MWPLGIASQDNLIFQLAYEAEGRAVPNLASSPLNGSSAHLERIVLLLLLALLLVVGLAAAHSVVSERQQQHEARAGILRSLRQLPRPLASAIPCSSRANIVYLYFTNCDPCESEYLRLFSESVLLWTRDLAPSLVHVEATNYLKDREAGRIFFDAFNVSRNMSGHSLLFIYSENEGFVFEFPDGSNDVPVAISYLTGSPSPIMPGPPTVQAAATYGLGLMVGTDPCFTAVVSSLYVSGGASRRSAARRVLAMAAGVAYAYTLLSFASICVEDLWSSVPLTSLTSVVTLFLALALIIDGVYSLTMKLKGFQAKSLLFKTPRKLTVVMARLLRRDTIEIDMVLGAFVAIFKLPCMAPQIFIVMLSSEKEFLLNVAAFAFGVASSAITIAILIILGIICTEKLVTLRWYGKSIQRIVIAIILAWTAFALLSR